MFNDVPLIANLVIFLGLAALIWFAGTRLSYYIDAIAEKTKISRGFLGLIILATATELPEFVTTLTASSQGTPSLALNNMFGGMMLQLAVLVAADFFVRDKVLSACPVKPTVAIAGMLCITSLSAILIVNAIGDRIAFAHIGYGALLIGGLYIISMYLLYQIQERHMWSPVDLPDEDTQDVTNERRYDDKTIMRLCIYSLICALVILGCGVLLVRLAETLAAQTGWGTSFIGVTLLALTTSMPELSTCIAAVRVGAYTMAISNIFGSNMIMTFLLLPNDIIYTQNAILTTLDKPTLFAVSAGIFMTAIYIISILLRPQKKIFRLGLDSWLMLLAYIGSIMILFNLRQVT